MAASRRPLLHHARGRDRRGDPLHIKKESDLAVLLDPTSLPPLRSSRREIIATSAGLQQKKFKQASTIEHWVIGFGAAAARQMRTPTRVDAETTSQPEPAEPRHRPDTIAAQLETIRLHQRLILESRARAAEVAWRRARIWRTKSMKALLALAAAGAAVACGSGLLVTIAAASIASEIAVARGRVLTDEARSASASVKATREEMRAEARTYFENVRSARRFRLDDIPPEARIAVGYVHLAVAVGRTPAPEVVDALNRAAPGLAEKVITVAEYGTSAAVARILNRMYRPKDERARQALALFVSNATPQPWGPKRPVGRSRGRDR